MSATRRTILGGAALAAIAAAPLAAAAQSKGRLTVRDRSQLGPWIVPPIAALSPLATELLRQLEETEAERVWLEAQSCKSDEVWDAWGERQLRVTDEIIKLPMTQEGTYLRARMLLVVREGNPEQLVSDFAGYTNDVRLAMQIAAAVARGV